MSNETKAPQPPAEAQCWCIACRPQTLDDMRFVVCPDCGNKRCPRANDHRHACTNSNEPGQPGSAYPAAEAQAALSCVTVEIDADTGKITGTRREPLFTRLAEAQAQGGGEALEAELIALVAGPYHYHHKMDEHAEREGKAFDRCRELTIQNIRTWCATRRAMLAAQPPSAPVGDDPIDASDNADYIEHCADRLERCGLPATAGALRVIAHEHRALAAAAKGFDAEVLRSALEEIVRRMPDQAGPAWIAKGIAQAALAQQPAAVDSEMVTRAVNAYDEATGEGWQMPCLQGMRAALTAALAGQQGGDNA